MFSRPSYSTRASDLYFGVIKLTAMNAAAATINAGPIMERLLRQSARAIVPRLASPSFETAATLSTFAISPQVPARTAPRRFRAVAISDDYGCRAVKGADLRDPSVSGPVRLC